MKRTLFVLSAFLTLSVFGTTNSHAVGNIEESPNIRIVIDGKTGTYSDTPIIQDGRTLLPLRAVLVNLGVQDDDSHIVWNSAEKSITVNKDSKKISLRVGSNNAQINGSSLLLDVPPLIYKDRTYVPARFIAESLGKKVVWDGQSKSVLIKDEKEYENVMEILGTVQDAMNSIKKGKLDITIENEELADNVNNSSKLNVKYELDYANKLSYMQMSFLDYDTNIETYYGNNTVYTNTGLQAKGWVKNTLSPDDYDEIFEEQAKKSFLDNPEMLAAALVVTANNDDEILLEGDTYSNSLLAFEVQGSDTNIVKKSNFSILIDKKNNYIKTITMEVEYIAVVKDKLLPLRYKASYTFTEINGDFEINIPENVITSANELSAES